MKKERAKENIAGPFYAVAMEYDCACGLPEGEAPDLIRMSELRGYQSYFYKQPESPEEISRAIHAINICPIHDLRYGGQDPEIIKRVDPSQSDFRITENGVVVVNEWST